MTNTTNATLNFTDVAGKTQSVSLTDWNGNLNMGSTVQNSQLYLLFTDPNTGRTHTVSPTDVFEIDLVPPSSFGVSITIAVPSPQGTYDMGGESTPVIDGTPSSSWIQIDRGTVQTGLMGGFQVPQTDGQEYEWSFTISVALASTTGASRAALDVQAIAPADPKLAIRNIKT